MRKTTFDIGTTLNLDFQKGRNYNASIRLNKGRTVAVWSVWLHTSKDTPKLVANGIFKTVRAANNVPAMSGALRQIRAAVEPLAKPNRRF